MVISWNTNDKLFEFWLILLGNVTQQGCWHTETHLFAQCTVVQMMTKSWQWGCQKFEKSLASLSEQT